MASCVFSMVTHNTGAGRWNTSGQRNNSLPRSHRKHTSGFLKPTQTFTLNCSPAFPLSVASLPSPLCVQQFVPLLFQPSLHAAFPKFLPFPPERSRGSWLPKAEPLCLTDRFGSNFPTGDGLPNVGDTWSLHATEWLSPYGFLLCNLGTRFLFCSR